MGQAPQHYLIFETAGGFCGIAWNNVGITRYRQACLADRGSTSGPSVSHPARARTTEDRH
jgi:hypothetical protein